MNNNNIMVKILNSVELVPLQVLLVVAIVNFKVNIFKKSNLIALISLIFHLM